MVIHACCGKIHGMDTTLLSTTNDIEELRTLALAMVQNVVSENVKKNTELEAREKQNAGLHLRIRLLEEVLMLARQQRYGRKCETLAGLQKLLFEEDVDTDIAATSVQLRELLQQNEPEEKTTPSRPVRKPLPAHLPRVIKTIEPVATENCADPECAGKLRHIRDEVSEKLEYIPARFVVNQYVRPQYSCTCCQRVVSGEMPAQIIPKGIAEASLVAQILISKYCDYQPLYRQQHVCARADIDLPVSTMAAGWVGAAGVALTPLVALLHQILLTRSVIHADETTMQILDTKKSGTATQGYIWSYVSGGKTGDSIACFECHPGRGRQYPMAFLSDWSGYLVTDDYGAYKSMAKQNPGIVNAGCWSHVRRRFADLYKANRDPRAGMALKMISQLFRLENKISGRPPEKIVQWRRRYAKPLLERLHVWLTDQKTTCPPGGALHGAVEEGNVADADPLSGGR